MENEKLGRPMLGKVRRVPVVLHIQEDWIPVIDEYVLQQKVAGKKAYSRSTFYDEAVKEYAAKIGVALPGTEKAADEPER